MYIHTIMYIRACTLSNMFLTSFLGISPIVDLVSKIDMCGGLSRSLLIVYAGISRNEKYGGVCIYL